MTAPARPALRPALRLDEIYPPACTYNPREPYGGNPFVMEDAAASNALTGGQLPIAGGLRVMCHRSVAGEQVLELVRRAGFPCDADLRVFGTEEEYHALLSAQGPATVVFQHAHPPDRVDPALYWVRRETLAALNDKSNLADLAPSGAVPARELLPTRGRRSAARWASVPVPVVLKVPSHHSLCSGEGVRICRDRAELRGALDDFAAASEVIVEEFLDLRGNWCVQFACLAGGVVRYLGCAEQLVDGGGRYWGNWITAAAPPDEVVELGRDIACRGAAAGYRGVAGFDVAVTRDGRVLVLDLNFRVNGSTFGLLYRPSVQELHGAGEIMFRTLRDGRGWRGLRRALEDLADGGQVLPFAGYDPADDAGGGVARASVLVTGRTRDDVARVVAGLGARGLS